MGGQDSKRVEGASKGWKRGTAVTDKLVRTLNGAVVRDLKNIALATNSQNSHIFQKNSDNFPNVSKLQELPKLPLIFRVPRLVDSLNPKR